MPETQVTFAFVANPGAKGERTTIGQGQNRPESDNVDSSAFALPPSVVVLARPQFWAHVNFHGPIHPVLNTRCWLWTGARTGSRSVKHGQVTWRAKYRTPQKAHRVAWELTYGPIPLDRQINHRCDNPICVRGDHLYLGTQRENMQDAARQGRFSVPHKRRLA